ncbi:MAG: hypothetical protein KBS95_05420 [Alistipes sp.]|nr:hypothetical protein [Candidatus Alistipes equi]
MKRIIYILGLLLLFEILPVKAQDVALYEHVPRIRVRQWYMDKKPEITQFVYLAFIDGWSEMGKEATLKAKSLLKQYKKLCLLVVVKHSDDNIPKWFTELLDEPRIGILLDSDFAFWDYGIYYSPVGVVVDHKRRDVWHGNPMDLQAEYLSNFIKEDTPKSKPNKKVLRKYNYRKEKKLFKRLYYENRALRKKRIS